MTSTSTIKKTPSNLRLRVIYGVLGAALLLGCVWGGPLSFGLFFGAVQALMLREFYRMMRAGGQRPAVGIGLGAGLLLFFGTFASIFNAFQQYAALSSLEALFEAAENLFNIGLLWRGLAVLLPVILLINEMLQWPRHPQPFSNAATVIFGLLYVSLPMTLLNVVAFGGASYDPRRIFALFFLVWASDIGAYAAGKSFGKHKMAPRISPGKTWEGWAGGFLLTLAVGWALQWLLPELPLAHRLVAAAVVAVFAPLGDLAESMLKRSVGVKDSGSIMPGHGGLLDRFDAFLLVLPVLALLQLLVG